MGEAGLVGGRGVSGGVWFGSTGVGVGGAGMVPHGEHAPQQDGGPPCSEGRRQPGRWECCEWSPPRPPCPIGGRCHSPHPPPCLDLLVLANQVVGRAVT